MGDIDAFFARRKERRNMHRTMTIAEYNCWRVVGDSISSPTETNPFPGGLTITFGYNSDIIGTTRTTTEGKEE